MADSYSKWVMTNAFASNSQAALNTGNKIEWVALKTSDDTHALNDLPGFNDTTLATAKIKQTSSINSVVINGNTVTITGLFNNAGNTADYYIKTIFLVAKYNRAEFLAGATVANTSGSAFRMPAASTTEITEFTARPQISVTNSSTISTTVDPVAAATNERVNSLETSLNSKIEDINTDKQKLWNKFADYVTKATAETITGVKTFTQTIVGSITGNAGTATKLQTGRKLNGATFDGTADITVPTNGKDENIDGIKSFTANIKTISDNSMINGGGNDQSLAMVKKNGGSPFIAIGSNNQFKVKQSNDSTVSPDKSFSELITVIPDGQMFVGNDQYKVSLDKNVAHPYKDEKVTGNWSFDNEILGTVTASKRPVMFDLADGTDLNSIRISGSYSCGSNKVGNSPINSWFSLVVVQNGQFNGAQTLTDTNSGNVYTRVWNTSGNRFSPWEKLSSDSKVVHNSGDETIYDRKTFDAVTTFNNGIVNKPISMNGFKIDVSKLLSGTYSVWQGDISGCPADFGVVEVFENISNTMYRFTQTDLQDGPHVWVQIKNSFGFSGWKQQM